MRGKRRHSGRVLGLIIASEVLILLVCVGAVYFWQLSGKAGGGSVQGATGTPLAVLSDVEAVVDGDLLRANPWLTKRWLLREVREGLGRQGVIEVVQEEPRPLPADRPVYRMSLNLVFDDELAPGLVLDPSAPELLVKLMTNVGLQRLPVKEAADRFEARDSREAKSAVEPGDKALDRRVIQGLVTAAVTAALDQATTEAQLGEKPTDRLVNEASTGSASHRVAALRVLGSRREAQALIPLVEALADESQDVVLAAMGALVERHDPATVVPLIESTRGRNLEYLSQVLYAVASIGGPDAAPYLDTMVYGHQNPEIRSRAAEALAELRARQGREAAASRGMMGEARGPDQASGKPQAVPATKR